MVVSIDRGNDTTSLARISHRVSSRGRRGAVPSGVFDPRGAERVLAVRRASRGEKTPLGAVHRRSQQEVRQAEIEFDRAVAEGDIDRFADLIAEDAVFIGATTLSRAENLWSPRGSRSSTRISA